MRKTSFSFFNRFISRVIGARDLHTSILHLIGCFIAYCNLNASFSISDSEYPNVPKTVRGSGASGISMTILPIQPQTATALNSSSLGLL